MVDVNNITRKKYWRHWFAYVEPLCIGHFLQTTEPKEVILATTSFTDRVRRWLYRNEKCVTVQTPQVALSAISKTIDLEGGISTIYQGYKKYIVSIQHQIEVYRCEEPPSTHKLAVPVATINLAYDIGNKSNNTSAEAVGQLFIIAFYFIPSIVEYTLPRVKNKGKRATRTIKF